VNEITGFTDSWDEVLVDVLTAVLFEPFRQVAQFILDMLVDILANTPRVYPNPAVQEIHQELLYITYLLVGLVVLITGILYMTSSIQNVPHRQVRQILPRLLMGVVFASVSLPLLQLQIDFVNALTNYFTPEFTTLSQIWGLSTSLVLIWMVTGVLLLALVLILGLRQLYILFVAAVSPLIALAWCIPGGRKYADKLIGGWFAALAIAPLDMIALKLMFSLLSASGNTLGQSVSNWVFGVAAILLLIFIPIQIWSISQSVVGAAYSVAGTAKSVISTRIQQQSTSMNLSEAEKQRLELYRAEKRQERNQQGSR
jgi:hypothetical protein